MKYAIVKNGTVANIVEWDGVSEFSVDGELIAVPSHAEGSASIGGQHDGTDNYDAFSYTPPTPPADTRTYDQKRATGYPSIGDQLDMLWHAIDTGDWTAAKVKTTEFYTALKAVKDANPK